MEPESNDRDVELGLDVLRGLADQEIARSERSASRARQAFALAAGFFAIVQTVALGSFAETAITAHERNVTIIIAIVGGGLLAACGFVLFFAGRAYRGSNLTSDNVLEAVSRKTEPAAHRLFELYATVVDELRDANARRNKAIGATQLLGLLSLLAVLAELAYSLSVRLT